MIRKFITNFMKNEKVGSRNFFVTLNFFSEGKKPYK